MIKVKFVGGELLHSNYNLTPGKIYDVFEFKKTGRNFFENVTIKNDLNILSKYGIYDWSNRLILIDVTKEYRSGIIDDILK